MILRAANCEGAEIVGLDRLAPTVAPGHTPQIALVIESIRSRGLIYPLFVEPWTFAEAKIRRERWGLTAAEVDDGAGYWRVRIGNQRFKAAYELGYTHIHVIQCAGKSDWAKHPYALRRRDSAWIEEIRT